MTYADLIWRLIEKLLKNNNQSSDAKEQND